MNPIKVLVVDDSAVVRQVMQAILGAEPDIQVIGVASDPFFAIERMLKQWPDVVVLDVEMPRMDGITFLRKIMAERPTPVVICSSLTEKGAQTTMQALAAGAVDIITKPTIGLRSFLMESARELVRTVRGATQVNIRNLNGVQAAHEQPGEHARSNLLPIDPSYSADAILQPGGGHAMVATTERIVALGTSTGGTQALEYVLSRLPKVCPGILVVQHMPEKFTASFAARLNAVSQIEVREARNNDRVLAGTALIASGGKHLLLKRSGASYLVEVRDGPCVNRHRPSVDVLFRSVAKFAGRNATGIIMTGMGDDGARGLKEMADAGANTYAQDQASCVVFGMPKEAIKLGGVKKVVELSLIPAAIISG